MTLSVLPALPGVGWNIENSPITSTRVLEAASGVEYRAQNWSYPKRKFSLPINFMRQFSNSFGNFTEWSQLVAFIESEAGMFGNFLYNNPFDNSVTNQSIGTGNGTTKAYPLVRTISGGSSNYVEPVLALNSLSAVDLNGSPTGAYTLSSTYGYANDTINFNSAPGNGVAITASFSFYFVCRFLTDTPEIMNFMNGRYSMKALDFQTVK